MCFVDYDKQQEIPSGKNREELFMGMKMEQWLLQRFCYFLKGCF